MTDKPQFRFRRAGQDDLPWLMGVYEKFYPLTRSAIPSMPEKFREFLGASMEVGAIHIFIAENNKDRVGAIGVVLVPAVFNTNHVVCSELFFWVDDDHRGTGVGHELLGQAESFASESGATVMNMVALQNSMPKSVGRMYESRGYRLIERLYEKEL